MSETSSVAASGPPLEPIKYVQTNLHLPYEYFAGDYKVIYLRGLKQGKIMGSKCSKTGKVFVPPLINSPESFAPCDEFVEVADKGVITTFCIVNIPVYGRVQELPYVCASVALDGASVSIFALIQECKVEDVRMGMRVEAVWLPEAERTGDHMDIKYFRPSGEPDAALETFIHRL